MLGLTGNIACGKSTVLAMLHELGAEPVDADAVYHALIEPGEPLWAALRAEYGPEFVTANGQIDRRALGARVFADPAELARLDALTHPAVVAEIERRIETTAADVIVIDAVKLFESGLAAACDAIWLVTSPPEVQIARLIARNGLSRAQAVARVAAQPSIEAKLARAGAVIDNGGDLAATRLQVEEAWTALRDSGAERADEKSGGKGRQI